MQLSKNNVTKQRHFVKTSSYSLRKLKYKRARKQERAEQKERCFEKDWEPNKRKELSRNHPLKASETENFCFQSRYRDSIHEELLEFRWTAK